MADPLKHLIHARINYNLARDAYDLYVAQQGSVHGLTMAASQADLDRFHETTGVLTREQVIAHADQMTDDINAAACDHLPLEGIIARIKAGAHFRGN